MARVSVALDQASHLSKRTDNISKEETEVAEAMTWTAQYYSREPTQAASRKCREGRAASKWVPQVRRRIRATLSLEMEGIERMASEEPKGLKSLMQRLPTAEASHLEHNSATKASQLRSEGEAPTSSSTTPPDL